MVSIVGRAKPVRVVKTTYMVVYRFEDLLGCDQQGSHFPNGHLKVHLWKFEEPISHQWLFLMSRFFGSYLLKKRGIRTLDRVAGVEPKLAGPTCWRGTEMWGFMILDPVFEKENQSRGIHNAVRFQGCCILYVYPMQVRPGYVILVTCWVYPWSISYFILYLRSMYIVRLYMWYI